MGLFDRLSQVLRSNINDLISRSEDPEKMLNQIIIDMRSQLVKAKQQVASAIADEKRLRDQADSEFKQAGEWEKRAVLAIQEGRDDLAKQALVRQGEHVSHGQQLEATWETHRMETEKLKNSLRDLNDKIEEAKRKKNLLVARQRRAQAQARIAETMSSLSEKSAFEAFARMEEKIETNERQLKASVEIDEEFSGDTLQNKFKALEKSAGTVGVDQQLAALKQKMGMLPSGSPQGSKQLGSGKRAEETVSAEIEPAHGDGSEVVTTTAVRQFRFGPVLTATVLTVLLLWLGGRASQVLLLLFLAILISLYLGAVADFITRRTRLPKTWSFLAALFLTLGALTGLFMLLVPPMIEQTQALIKVLPVTLASWEAAIDRLVLRFPALSAVWTPGTNQIMNAVTSQISGSFGSLMPKVVGFVHAFINIFSVLIMSIYLGLQPALYREWLIALFPPIHRDLVRDVLADLADTLRSWIVGQLFAMFVLAVFTAVGLWYLDVPYWLTFSVFTGVVAIVPFFGTLVSTVLPALFVLGAPDGVWRAFLVIVWGIVVHLVEGNFVVPRVMSHKVDLPPVLTIMSVLIMGSILGPMGLLIAVPSVAVLMVVVRRILISRLYEGHGFRKTVRDNALILRVPVPEAGVLLPTSHVVDVLSVIEGRIHRKTAQA